MFQAQSQGPLARRTCSGWPPELVGSEEGAGMVVCSPQIREPLSPDLSRCLPSARFTPTRTLGQARGGNRCLRPSHLRAGCGASQGLLWPQPGVLGLPLREASPWSVSPVHAENPWLTCGGRRGLKPLRRALPGLAGQASPGLLWTPSPWGPTSTSPPRCPQSC